MFRFHPSRVRGGGVRNGGRAAGSGSLGRRLYPAAALVVLLAAAALRFYDLAGDSLWYDEAVAALNSQGSFTETVEWTRAYNTSPILYPLALWVVQKVEISNFSVRLLPAVGSTATVAVLLFLLPGAGAGRRTALFAGALAAVSSAAIVEAQGVREYSLDALVAALLLAGLLRHLGGRGRVLLPLALFLGPFVQYGLVLFGGAVLVVAFAFGGGAGEAGARAGGAAPGRGGFAGGLRARLGPVVPAAAFAVACAGSYFATLRGQLEDSSLTMGHLASGYYRGEPFDFAAVLAFAGAGAWETLAHHLTAPFTSAAVLALALPVVTVLARKRLASRLPAPTEAAGRPLDAGRVLPALLAVSLLVAVAAALAGAYPLGSLRQNTYLGPVVFAAAAVVWGRFADTAAALLRRPAAGWLAAAALAGGVWAGTAEIARTAPFGSGGNIEEVLAELTGRAREGDLVYASGVATPPTRFYAEPRPEGLVFGANGCYRGFADCAREVLEIGRSRIPAPDRVWVIHAGATPAAFRGLNPALEVERIVSGTENLYLVPNLGEVVRAENRSRFAEYESAFDDREEPTVRSRFDLRHREDFLFYRREACSAADLEARFFLRFQRADAAGRRTVVRDFDFPEYGVLVDGVCAARVPLPPGDFDLVSTGQSAPEGPPRWEARWRLDLASYRAALDAISSGRAGPPVVRSGFDLYLDGGSLRYYRAPCRPEDLDARFFLHLHPDPGGGSDPPGENEFELRDFDFHEHGIVEDGRCLAIVPLPAEGYPRFETGQWSETVSWRAAAVLDRARHRAALRSRERGEWGEPETREEFDLYLLGDELRYVREPCAARDVEERFFLHLHGLPVETDAGSSGRRFENRDFDFAEYGALLDGVCLAMVPLPAADAHRISTGQFAAGDPPTWRTDLWPRRRRFEARLESIASGGLGPPAARSVFDLYFDDTEVLFHRASCSESDVEAKFFLHFYPEEEAALPADRRDHGFLNLDFDFADSGFLLDSRCVAGVPLPGSGGGRLRAGQFLPGGERLWSAELDFPPSR